MNHAIQSLDATIVQLPQGSSEWLEYRRSRRNASESAAVLGHSPWQTPYQLWQAKTGRFETKITPAMQRGTDLKSAARRAYEEHTGLTMQPLVLDAGGYSASLDGITLEGDLVLKVECPAQGNRSELWQDVAYGQVPEHYLIQVQHELMVSAAACAHLWVCDGERSLLHQIDRDELLMANIREGWEDFQQYLDTDTPPPLSDGDAVLRSGHAWAQAVSGFAQAKRQADSAAETPNAARLALVALTREQGAGLAVTRFWKTWNVDYKKVPQIKGVNLDVYRAKSRKEIRLAIS